MKVNSLELKIPPVVLALIFAGTMWGASALLPAFVFAIPGRDVVAMALASLGVAFTVAGVVAFRNAKTTVNPTRPDTASSMVISGVYRVSRNPMYVGFLILLAAWATLLSHAGAFILLPGFVVYMNRFQISPEERALALKFGNQFANYQNSVRRWL